MFYSSDFHHLDTYFLMLENIYFHPIFLIKFVIFHNFITHNLALESNHDVFKNKSNEMLSLIIYHVCSNYTVK